MGNAWETRALGTGQPAKQDTFAPDRETLEHSIQSGPDRSMQVGELNQPLRNDFNRQQQQTAPAQQPAGDDGLTPEEREKGYLRHADYTRKTQEAAQVRREAEQAKADALRMIAETQRIQAQLMQSQQQPQQAESGWFAPDDLAGLDPQAQQALRILEQKAEQRIQTVAERQQKAYEQRLSEVRSESIAKDIFRQQAEFQQNNPSVTLEPGELQSVYQVIAANPQFRFEDAIRAAAPRAYDQIVIDRYQRAQRGEAQRQQQASALQQRSGVLGAAATYRPGESMRDSFNVVAAQNPEVGPETLQVLGMR